MKNTKFRRRALISSVAMLLVALGSATFAWFTSSTTATASGINVQTTQASELQISKTNLSWGTSVNYNKTGVFEPASSEDGTHWYTTEAGARDNYEKKSSASFNALTSSNIGDYVYEESLNVKNAGTAPVDNVTISWSWPETAATSGAYYLRIALVEVTPSGEAFTETTLGAAKPADAAAFRAGVYAADTTSYNPVDSTGAVSATAISPKNTYSINVGKLTSGAIKYYKLFVWFEGQDTDCKDTNAGNQMPSISFNVTGTTVQS